MCIRDRDTTADEDNYALNVKKNTSPSLVSKAGLKYKYNISESWNINGDLTWYHSSKKPRNTHADFIFKPEVHYTIPALKVSKDTEVINLNVSYTAQNLLEYNVGSVSYTHLDVYKRQYYCYAQLQQCLLQ